MTFAILPLQPDLEEFTFRTTLKETEFRFDFYWNKRDAAWYFTLSDSQNDPIVSGVRVVIGSMLTRRCRDPRKPQGVFIAIDKDGTDIDPTLTDLGTRVVIVFTDGL